MNEERTCRNCVHFRIHYERNGKYFVAVQQGHCFLSVMKIKTPDTKGCACWKPMPK